MLVSVGCPSLPHLEISPFSPVAWEKLHLPYGLWLAWTHQLFLLVYSSPPVLIPTRRCRNCWKSPGRIHSVLLPQELLEKTFIIPWVPGGDQVLHALQQRVPAEGCLWGARDENLETLQCLRVKADTERSSALGSLFAWLDRASPEAGIQLRTFLLYKPTNSLHCLRKVKLASLLLTKLALSDS